MPQLFKASRPPQVGGKKNFTHISRGKRTVCFLSWRIKNENEKHIHILLTSVTRENLLCIHTHRSPPSSFLQTISPKKIFFFDSIFQIGEVMILCSIQSAQRIYLDPSLPLLLLPPHLRQSRHFHWAPVINFPPLLFHLQIHSIQGSCAVVVPPSSPKCHLC